MKVFCSMFSYLNIEMNFAGAFTALHTPTSGLIGMFLIKLSALFNLYYDQEGQPDMHSSMLWNAYHTFDSYS